MISSHARGCPVLLVGTHADSKRLTPELGEQVRAQLTTRYRARFDSLSQLVLVSGKTGRGVNLLLDALQSVATQQPCMGAPLPDIYHGLSYQLRNVARSQLVPIISAEKFSDIAAKCGIARNTAPAALEALQELGVVLFVRGARGSGAEKALVHLFKNAASQPQSDSRQQQKRESQRRSSQTGGQRSSAKLLAEPELPTAATGAGLVVLDPLWLARVLRSFVKHKDTYLKRGVLLHKDAEHIWRPPEHPAGVAATYLDLLEKLEMTFPLARMYREEHMPEQSTDKSIVPLLLQAEPPPGLDPLGKQYGFLTEPSILTHMYTRRHRHSGNCTRDYTIRRLNQMIPSRLISKQLDINFVVC